MAEATPRPWEYRSDWSQILSPVGVVADLKQRGMVEEVAIGEYELPEMDANGSLIVEAVNSFDAFRALLEAAEAVDEWYGYAESGRGLTDERYFELMDKYGSEIAWQIAVTDAIRAAIERVKGEGA